MQIKIESKNFSKVIKALFKFYCFKTKQNKNVIYKESEQKYKYTFDYTESMSCYNFCKVIEQEYPQYLNLNFLYTYFNFEFTKYDWIKDENEKTGKSFNLKLQFIFGKKALKAFLQKTHKNDYFYHTKFYPKYKIELKDLENFLVKEKLIQPQEDNYEKKIIVKPSVLNQREELNKEKYLNSEKGFFYCLQTTTLFKFNSPTCKKCLFKQKCKNVLKTNFQRLYAKRFARFLIEKENERAKKL